MDGQAPKLKVHQPNLHGASKKRSSPSIFGQSKAKVPRKRGRTKQDFLNFCLTVLKHANYHPEESDKPSGELDYNMNSRSSPVSDSLGSDSGGSHGAHGYDGSSTATAISSSSACSSEDETITCFCNKPYANRPMIQCGSCETWIHLSCAKIRRTHIPDVYICTKCRDASQSARKSSRPRVENKKFSEEL